MRFVVIALALSLGACSPEGFEVRACSSGGQLAFRIHKIDGWLRDYQPRPNWILVRETHPMGNAQAVWNVRINDPKSSGQRPSRENIAYGQPLPGWDVDVAPLPLRRGTEYYVHVSDGGRSGDTQFVAGDHLPTC